VPVPAFNIANGRLTRLPGLRMTVPMSELEFREGQTIASMRELLVTWDDA